MDICEKDFGLGCSKFLNIFYFHSNVYLSLIVILRFKKIVSSFCIYNNKTKSIQQNFIFDLVLCKLKNTLKLEDKWILLDKNRGKVKSGIEFLLTRMKNVISKCSMLI